MRSFVIFLFLFVEVVLSYPFDQFEDQSDEITMLMEHEQLNTSCTRNDGKEGVLRLTENCRKIECDKVKVVGFIRALGAVVCCNEQAQNRIELPVGTKAKEFCKKISKRPLSLKDLILRGTRSSVSEFPHVVALGYDKFGTIEYDCGASLISENFVLTAAHCVNLRDRPVKTVRIGRVGEKLKLLRR